MAITHKLLLSVDTMDAYMSLFGFNDQNVALIEQECSVNVALRGAELHISGEENDVVLAESVVTKLCDMIRRGDLVDRSRIRYAIALAREGKVDMIDEILRSVVAITHRGKQIRCKTLGQQEYVQAIRDHDLTFAVGPAGTGKTYLAMALAVVALKNKEIERIVLTRPAVEAGEKDSYQKLVERGVVEVAPLAYMRGRTLSDSFIILDEAQNTTSEQMKMFLTRLGFNSKVVVTGDVTQTDLPFGKRSGLAEALEILDGIPEIGIVKLTSKDVVRHELVQRIVDAYEAHLTQSKQAPKA